MSVRRAIVLFALVAAITGAIAGTLVVVALDDGGGDSAAAAVLAPVPTGMARSPEEIYRGDSRGVVVITDQQTEVVPPTSFSPGGKQQVGALGSGFVIDRRGNIVTNDHVVQGATDIRVGLSGGASLPAEIVGTDPSSDLAVLRVKAPSSALHPLAFADSSRVEVGDPAYAIGNPFGLERTMTAGIVSATGRDIKAPNGLTIPNAVQTDAAINHGNSGGPLLDRHGHVIGVNAQIEGGTVDANVGIGFAIPSATVRSVATQLISNGHAEHAFLGVEVGTIDQTLEKLVAGLPARGVLVLMVTKGSPAAKAGLESTRSRGTTIVGGDAIVAVDGRAVDSSAQLSEVVAGHKPGDELTLRVVRNGSTRTIHVTLGNAPT